MSLFRFFGGGGCLGKLKDAFSGTDDYRVSDGFGYSG